MSNLARDILNNPKTNAPTRIRVLALDPSIANLGWAFMVPGGVAASGTWHPSKAKAAPEPFDQLADWLCEQVRSRQPEVVVVEIPDGGERFKRFGGKIIKLGGAQERAYARAVGACESVPRAMGIPVVRVSVNGWKGTAKKGVTARYVLAAYRLDPQGRTDNETDAIGIGDWYLRIGRHRGVSP